MRTGTPRFHGDNDVKLHTAYLCPACPQSFQTKPKRGRCPTCRGPVSKLGTKRHKFGAVPTIVDGIRFASKHEASCYVTLKAREKAGEISGLTLQPEFVCRVSGYKICTYRADFEWIDNGLQFVGDAKGYRTPVYKLKKKLVNALFGIDILEL